MRLALWFLLAACNHASRGEPTYHRDIAPLITKHCQPCHGAGGVEPNPSLADFANARTYAQPMALAVEGRLMPPWLPNESGACASFADSRWLDVDALSTFAAWQANGAPEGDPFDVVSTATQLPLPFHPDAVLDIGGVYHPGVGSGGNRCFLTDPGLDRDRLLTAIRVVSDDSRGIAQLTLFALDSEAAETAAADLDSAEPGLGWSCFGTARVPDARLVASWTWPTPYLEMPPGTGVRLGADRKLVVQIHYDVAHTGDAFVSQTLVELQLDEGVREAKVLALTADGPLAPGRTSVAVDAELPVTQPMRIVGIAPRMHIRGRSLTVLAERAGCLGYFDRWRFNDQQLFRPLSPKTVEPGDRLHLSCSYSTLGRTEPIAFGDSIDDEECAAYLFVTE